MTTFEKIPELIRDAGLINWLIKSSDKGENNVVFRSDDSLTVEANIERMRKVMSCYTGDYFVLVGYDKPNSTRGGCRWDFANNGTRGFDAPAMVGAAGGHSDAEVQSLIDVAVGRIEQKYAEQELKRREQELKEREHDYNTGLGLALSKLGAAWKRTQPAIAVSGIGERPIPAAPAPQIEPTAEQPEADESNRAAELLNRWLSVDEQAIDVLDKIVCVAESGVFNSGIFNLSYEQLKTTLLTSE